MSGRRGTCGIYLVEQVSNFSKVGRRQISGVETNHLSSKVRKSGRIGRRRESERHSRDTHHNDLSIREQSTRALHCPFSTLPRTRRALHLRSGEYTSRRAHERCKTQPEYNGLARFFELSSGLQLRRPRIQFLSKNCYSTNRSRGQ